ncbi:ferrous iron transporter FeoB [Thermanaerovibrio velox DSM 12556]|uniref:Ferrous iron transport protein B n=1 Tax=Thermanaerovibrio velox DSM 12556 TaxID=926567 RepID=H0UR38_9BACT|nr:ferrous iron transport protein B [Thermanaerovibrio velox]EHM10875.1 ferrous iron transporter FeoB [Thermanaerovibrio velox DSM 12556]
MSALWALAGNPNVGKTSLFNCLTGSRQKVGNWPGVTVERKEGRVRTSRGEALVVDLPGIYGLGASSVDEQIASQFISEEPLHGVILVLDAAALERSLYLALQVRERGKRVLCALNMVDMAEQKGIRVDVKGLEEALGVQVVQTVARSGRGVEDLIRAMEEAELASEPLAVDYGEAVGASLRRLEGFLSSLGPMPFDARTGALMAAEGDPRVWVALGDRSGGLDAVLAEENRRLEDALGMDLQSALMERRWSWVSALASRVISFDPSFKPVATLDDRLDRVFTNRLLGLPIFLLVAWGMFKVTFALGTPIADWLDGLFASAGELAAGYLESLGAPALLGSLVGDGMIGGVGSVLVFVPHIFILFALIGVLEDTGYMARGAFVMDRIMRAMGLHGKSFIPMLLGFGCGVPAMMATRILESPRDRKIAILSIPFISCSARLPVLVMFSGAFFPRVAGNVVFGMYLLGIVVSVLSAKLFSKTIFKGEPSQFIMELPPYRLPQWSGVLSTALLRSSQFVRKAGTFILGTVLVIWALGNLPFGVEYASEESLIGRIGSLLAPLLSPLGFGFWQAGVSLIFGFLAKEVVIGAFGTIMGVGDEGLAAALQGLFTTPAALAFMVMSLLYVPCVAALSAMYKETQSIKWTLFAALYSTSVGYLGAFVAYRLALAAGL